MTLPPQVGRADEALQEAHGRQALQVQSLRTELRAQRPPGAPHEETLAEAHEELTCEGRRTSQG